MNVSYKWLQDFISLTMDPKDLAEKMTMAGVPVEELSFLGESIEKVVVGRIEKIEKHPNADKLLICSVNVGGEQLLQIVTGASNVYEGSVIPVALHGSSLPGGTKIKKGKLRGVESEGMLCSAKELAIGADLLSPAQKEGIFLLPSDCQVGQDIKDVLGLDDVVMVAELTPNRADCFSHIGMAREAAVLTGGVLKSQECKLAESENKIDDMLTVENNSTVNCRKYLARMIRGVKIADSPLWLQNRLRAVGQRPISNIVDVTNYIMFAYGQPLHAFDYAKISDKKIIVRQALPGEIIKTLDGNDRKLSPEMLVIADAEKAVAIAGVMGGENSEVSDSTCDIVLECADFYGGSIRKTAQSFALRSEASNRYEKGIDPGQMEFVVDLAASMMADLAGGEVVGGRVCALGNSVNDDKILFDCMKINSFLGTDITENEMKDIISKLGFILESSNGKINLHIPSYRRDISRIEDIAEEVARIFGYDNIKAKLPSGVLTEAHLPNTLTALDKCRDILVEAGYNETITFSFINPSIWDKLNIVQDDPWRVNVCLKNPVSEEFKAMRTTLLPSLLEVLRSNINRQNKDVKIFETARVYKDAGENLKWTDAEQTHLAILLSSETVKTWLSEGDEQFFELKGLLENITEEQGFKAIQYKKSFHPSFHPGRYAEVYINENKIGFIGEIAGSVMNSFEVDQRAVYLEIDLSSLLDGYQKPLIRYKQLPKYPSVQRDLAFLAPVTATCDNLFVLLGAVDSDIIESIQLFDVYNGSQIPEGYKSMAFKIILRSQERTLTDNEVDAVIDLMKSKIKDELGVELRK